MEEMLKLVGNFGFPMVVTSYVLIRIEGRLNDLSACITELAKAVAVLKA
ncbi:MAG TPA: YvrJ family protein [Desulfosporosinus sp.]